MDDDEPVRLEGQAEHMVRVPLGHDPELPNLLVENPDWYLFPYVRAGGRIIFGPHVAERPEIIHNRLVDTRQWATVEIPSVTYWPLRRSIFPQKPYRAQLSNQRSHKGR